MNKIKVLIVDDHAILREGIRALLCENDDIVVVGEASEGKEAIEKARELTPDVILMDLVMPGIDGLEAIRRIRDEIPASKILVLTQYETKEYILAAIKAGAIGYIAKKTLSSELVSAIRAVNQGNLFLYSSAAVALIEDYRQQIKPKPHDPLTPKEKEILRLIAEGKTSRKISETLHISFRTVQNHRLKIAKKLGIHNHTELLKYAMHMQRVNTNT
jgi:two-component system response regulator NreC